MLEVGDLRLDPATQQVWRGEEEIELSRKEFALLETFMRRPGEVSSKFQLLERAWDYDYENRSNVVEVYVRYLREKIDRPFGVKSIETVRGAGYRLRKDGGDREPPADPGPADRRLRPRDAARARRPRRLFVYVRQRADLDRDVDHGLERARMTSPRSSTGPTRRLRRGRRRLTDPEEGVHPVLTRPGGRAGRNHDGLRVPALSARRGTAGIQHADRCVERELAGIEGTARMLARPITVDDRPARRGRRHLAGRSQRHALQPRHARS